MFYNYISIDLRINSTRNIHDIIRYVMPILPFFLNVMDDYHSSGKHIRLLRGNPAMAQKPPLIVIG